MDHKERVWNALHFRPVDRIPFDMFDEAGYLFNNDRYDPGRRPFLTIEDQVQARIRFHQEFDTDLIFDTPVIATGSVPFSARLLGTSAERYDINFATFPTTAQVWHPWPPMISPKPGVIVAEDTYIDVLIEWENEISCPLKLELASGTLTGYDRLMKSLDEWTAWQEILTPNLEGFNYSYVNQILKATKSDIALYGTIIGPFGMYALLFGSQEASYLLVDKPEKVHEILSWLTEVTIEVGRDLIHHGVDILRIGEAGTSLLSKGIYRSFVSPYHQRLSEALQSAGGVPIIHICGTCNRLLESLAEAGIVALETLTPPPLGDVELYEVKRRIGAQVCLKGNLDPVHIVAPLSPKEVAEMTQHTLEIGAKGGGYIFSVADCLVPDTPIENLQAIAEVIHNFQP